MSVRACLEPNGSTSSPNPWCLKKTQPNISYLDIWTSEASVRSSLIGEADDLMPRPIRSSARHCMLIGQLVIVVLSCPEAQRQRRCLGNGLHSLEQPAIDHPAQCHWHRWHNIFWHHVSATVCVANTCQEFVDMSSTNKMHVEEHYFLAAGL